MSPKRILLCGHRSFAARGLEELLSRAGHQVTFFSRGDLRREGDVVTGAVEDLHKNPLLIDPYDTVINYIFLQGLSAEANIAYVRSLLDFCKGHGVRHLIHISTCSVYKNSAKHINEAAPVETNPKKKGPYAAIKIAAENYIRQNLPEGMRVSQIRPGLILGAGMGGYMGGIGIRLPWNKVIGLGNAKSQLPVISREVQNQAILRLVLDPPQGQSEVILLASSHSPTRREYLNACCTVMGSGLKVYFFPVPAWLTAAAGLAFITHLVGKGGLGVYSKVRTVCRFQRYDTSTTERRSGLSFDFDWKKALAGSFEGNEKNFSISIPPKLSRTAAKRITFIGFGRIVKQRHLGSLKKLDFGGEIQAFDLMDRTDESGVAVRNLKTAKPVSSDLFVVATPGPTHIEAIDHLRSLEGTVLVEKPLCYSAGELDAWLAFAAERKWPVLACHSSRFRPNVVLMMEHLARYNPGKLYHVSVVFQSPPVAWDSSLWLRDERRARTLLMDYGIHTLDIACMFSSGEARLDSCRYELNLKGQAGMIQGHVSFDNHSVDFVLRQGLFPRKSRVLFTFQNYAVSLGFSPDTFVPQMTDDNFGLSWIEAKSAFLASMRKVKSYATKRESDNSHAHVFNIALGEALHSSLSVENLAPFYRLMFEISKFVYDQ